MAQISVEAYVNERRGKMLRISEQYRRKDQSGGWETSGYGNFTVWLRDDDQQPEIQSGAVVLVSGDLRAEEVEKDGRKYTNLNIGFAKVGLVRTTGKYQGAGQPQTQSANHGQGGGGWAAPGASQGGQPGGNWDTSGDLPPF